MKKHLIGIGLSAMLVATNVSADYVSGDMTLRDAMYLYGQDVDARGSKTLGGHNCDVFQLVLDVTSGHTDLAMFQGDTDSELSASTLVYPDRIYDSAAMFSYALYRNKTWKMFEFNDKNNPLSTAQVGTGTVFGYCYSTKPDAYVYFYEEDNQYDLAIQALKAGLAKVERPQELHFRLAVLYEKQNNRPESNQQIKRVLELDPHNADAQNFLRYSYAEAGEDLDEAERLIREALHAKPNSGHIIDSLGWVYYAVSAERKRTSVGRSPQCMITRCDPTVPTPPFRRERLRIDPAPGSLVIYGHVKKAF